MRFRRHLLAAWVALWLATPVLANNYPDIHWRTIETPHFVIHYYDDVAWTARKVAMVAEEIYPKVTGIYNYEPARRTHIVVRDDEDTSNGMAVFNLGYITIWASPSDLRLRGRGDWVRGTVTHEFSHVISLYASSHGGWLVEGMRFGGVSNADTQSNVSVGATILVPTHRYSRWWAEGTAQLNTAEVGYDLWDTNQDTLLRAATLEENLLTFDQMRNINVRENYGGELVYNQGYSFLLWLSDHYGKDANLKVTRSNASTWNLDFDRNLEVATGKSPRALYDEWKRYLVEKYTRQVAEISKAPLQGERIALLDRKTLSEGDPEDRSYKDGVANALPRFSPDGHWFSWVNRTTLHLRYLDEPFVLTTPETAEDSGVRSGARPEPLSYELNGRYYSWAPDSRRIVLSDRRSTVLGGYPYYDLFLADLGRIVDLRTDYLTRFRKTQTDVERKGITSHYLWKLQGVHVEPARITRRQRATQPAWSPDGAWIAFSENRDGHRNLRLIRPDGAAAKDLVAIGGDSEAIEPAWSPDSKRIAFTLFHHGQADIWTVESAGGAPQPLTFDAAVDGEPTFTPDGKEVIFSSDRTGIFQIYRIPSSPGTLRTPSPLTNVPTGASMPFAAPSGNELLYLRYSSFGYKPYWLPLTPFPTPEPEVVNAPPDGSMQKQLTAETIPPLPTSSRYFPWPRPARLFPTFIVENDQFKAGMEVEVSDFLEQHSLQASVLFGEDQDYQITYRNRMFYPDIMIGYTSYIRNDDFPLLNGSGNLPAGNLRDNIQFVTAGLSQDFTLRHGLPGTHTLSLTYNRRFVDQQIGFPVVMDNALLTDFRLISNDSFSLDWNYKKVPAVLERDFDINPRNATYASLGYSLVRTHLFFPDTTLPGPNQNYWYHEATAAFSKYMALPWTRPWWNHHTFWLHLEGGIKSRDVTNLDEFFLGGRLNYRAFGQISSNTLFYGYEAFSISGETLLLLSTGYTFPIARAIDKKVWLFYFDSVYASIFGEAGNAWSFGEVKNVRNGDVLLEDIGMEIRLKSFFLNDNNRWNSVVRVAYGFQDNARSGFSNNDLPIRIYIGIGTDF